MTRRLSITVSDDLWDAVSHLAETQSGVVQKALSRLRDTEGPRARTNLEKEAESDPVVRRVLSILEDYGEEAYREGYQHVLDALDTNVITAFWVERMAQNYPQSKLGKKLAEAARVFVERRHDDPEGNGRWIEQPVTVEDLPQLLDSKELPEEWATAHTFLLSGLCEIIVTAPDPGDLLASAVNRGGEADFGPDGNPTVGVPLLLWEGMAAAIFDAVAAMHRMVKFPSRSEEPPSTGDFVDTAPGELTVEEPKL